MYIFQLLWQAYLQTGVDLDKSMLRNGGRLANKILAKTAAHRLSVPILNYIESVTDEQEQSGKLIES